MRDMSRYWQQRASGLLESHTQEALWSALGDCSLQVRIAAILHPDATQELWYSVLNGTDLALKICLLKSRMGQIPVAWVESLLQVDAPESLLVVALKYPVNFYTLNWFSTHRSWRVRLAVARNLNVSNHLLVRLIRNNSEDVSITTAALLNPKLEPASRSDICATLSLPHRTYLNLLASSQATEGIANWLSSHSHWLVRQSAHRYLCDLGGGSASEGA